MILCIIVMHGHRVQDEIERTSMRVDALAFFRTHERRRADALRVRLLRSRAREHRHLASQRPGDLHRHLPESTQPDDAHPRPARRPVPPHRIVHRDSRAHHRRTARRTRSESTPRTVRRRRVAWRTHPWSVPRSDASARVQTYPSPRTFRPCPWRTSVLRRMRTWRTRDSCRRRTRRRPRRRR